MALFAGHFLGHIMGHNTHNEDTDNKSVSGSTQDVVERVRGQLVESTSLLPPFLDKIDVRAGNTLLPFVDAVGALDSRFTIGSIEQQKNTDFTLAEVTNETVEDTNLAIGIDSTVNNFLDIQIVKRIEEKITEALTADTTIHHDMTPNWLGAKAGILDMGSDIFSVPGYVYIAVSLHNYLELVGSDELLIPSILKDRLRLVVMENFTDNQLLIMHEYGVAGGLSAGTVSSKRDSSLDTTTYVVPFTYSFGWDPKYVRFSGATLGRYFRRNEGTTDYASIPAVTLTGDCSIDFKVLIQTAGTTIVLANTLATGDYVYVTPSGIITAKFGSQIVSSTAVFQWGVFNELSIVRVGNVMSIIHNGVEVGVVNSAPVPIRIDTLGRYMASASYWLAGILADLKIYDNGVFIRDYPIGDNSDVLVDLVSDQNGIVINGNSSDWSLFEEQPAGNWLGQELWLLPTYSFNGTETNTQIPQAVNILNVGFTYSTSITQSGPNTGNGTRALIGNQLLAGAPESTVTGDLVPTSTLARWQVVGTPPFEGSVTLSVREVLNNAEVSAAPVDSQGGTYFPLRNTATDPVSPEYTAQSYTFVPNDGLYFDTYLANAYKLFANNTTFVGDPDMALWDVSRIHSMNRMFYGASVFNIDLGSWDTSYVSNFYWTFKDAAAFNQDLSQWDVTRDAGHTGFSDGSALTTGHLPSFI